MGDLTEFRKLAGIAPFHERASWRLDEVLAPGRRAVVMHNTGVDSGKSGRILCVDGDWAQLRSPKNEILWAPVKHLKMLERREEESEIPYADRGPCPECNEYATSVCKCRIGDAHCENGHTWHKVEGKVVLGSGHKTESTRLEQKTITLKAYCDKLLDITFNLGNAIAAPMEYYAAAADLLSEIGRMFGKGSGDLDLMDDVAEVVAKLQARSAAHRETNNWTDNP